MHPLITGALLTLAASTAIAQEFYALPDLPGGGETSRANAVSGDSRVVVGVGSSSAGTEALRWNFRGAQSLGLSDLPGGGFSSEAFAVSQDGSVVFGVGTNALDQPEAFRWTAGTGMVGLGFLTPGSIASHAYGCSDDGSQACGEDVTQTPLGPRAQAVRWTPSGVQGLGFLPGGTSSTARAMSADGTVIVGWAEDGDGIERPFLWTAEVGMVAFLGDSYTGRALCITSNGESIGGTVNGLGFEWTGGRTPPLKLVASGSLQGPYSVDALDDGVGRIIINDPRGSSVEIFDTDVWFRYYVSDRYAPGWTLHYRAMSDTGRIVAGWGTTPTGAPQGWAMHLPYQYCNAWATDFNGDGDFSTDADIEAFIACVGGNCCPTCWQSTDVNFDGDEGTDADIECYISIITTTCCSY